MLARHSIISAVDVDWGDFGEVINRFLSNDRVENGNMEYLKFGFLCFETALP